MCAMLPIFAAAALLAGCAPSDSPGAGDTDHGPAAIVATTQVWADIAAAVTGEPVEAIITGTATDPHHFEPAAADFARLSQAEVVVANGGGYDVTLYSAVEPSRVIHALPLVHADHNHNHNHNHARTPAHGDADGGAFDTDGIDGIDDIEHAWFSPEKVADVARQIEARAGGSATDVVRRMDVVSQRLAALPQAHVVQTEPIAAGLIHGSQLRDITPGDYLRAAVNHTEPSVEAIAACIEMLQSGSVDFLIYNPQSTNNAAQPLVEAATENNVPIIEVTETPPNDTDFLDSMDEITTAVERIASSAAPSGHGVDHDTEVPAA